MHVTLQIVNCPTDMQMSGFHLHSRMSYFILNMTHCCLRSMDSHCNSLVRCLLSKILDRPSGESKNRAYSRCDADNKLCVRSVSVTPRRLSRQRTSLMGDDIFVWYKHIFELKTIACGSFQTHRIPIVNNRDFTHRNNGQHHLHSLAFLHGLYVLQV
ncbi:hypothetical protein D3C71_1470150 [compost metagenome]